ncbi:MAG TPA: ABC transporter substrate-binding protein [Methylomirabilota bacterium]|nr:ABC transporter substrate-binding protein [Methylomirabilota bacterium]
MRNIIGLIGMLVVLLTCETAARAQQPAKVWKIGQLVSSSAPLNAARDEALRQKLGELGYAEGKNIVMEYRYADGKLDRLDQLARELVEQKPDVIVVSGTGVAVAAKKATGTIPIVVVGAGDLVEAGLIKSFMYPGSNVTGVARMSPDFFGMRLKLIKEVLPKATQVAALSNPKTPGNEGRVKDFELGAKALGLGFQSLKASSTNQLDGAIGAAAKGGANALFPLRDSLFNNNVSLIAQSATKNRIAVVYDLEGFVEAGGLMSYGVNLADMSRRGAEYVDKILKGDKPQDLPLVQSMKFDLSINLKTANQIGVAIPPEVVQRAVKVIK